jgi:V/A-type H+-transporting ATPase subunit I
VVPAVWFNFHHLVKPGPEGLAHSTGPVTSIVQVLLITLYFGIAIISLGLVLNWINLIRTKKWALLIFDRMGLVGGWMYFGSIYVVYRFALTDFKALPGGLDLLFALGLPALIFLGKPVVEFFEHRAEHPEKRFTVFTPIGFFFSWLLELLEFFTGYLSNTLSFMRVAGLGIAHVALMIAFAQIAEMLNKADLPAVGVAVYVIGNIFVIALEGLSAGIQSLRLNYYEFFSKYFKGSGEAYAPVSLRGQ